MFTATLRCPSFVIRYHNYSCKNIHKTNDSDRNHKNASFSGQSAS